MGRRVGCTFGGGQGDAGGYLWEQLVSDDGQEAGRSQNLIQGMALDLNEEAG